jgi:hypothetical protein
LPENTGVGHSKTFHLDEGLNYIETLYTPSKDMSVLSFIEAQEPRIVVTLGVRSCLAKRFLLKSRIFDDKLRNGVQK